MRLFLVRSDALASMHTKILMRRFLEWEKNKTVDCRPRRIDEDADDWIAVESVSRMLSRNH